MALAAAELYRATGQAAFLQEAKQYAGEAGSAPFDVDHVHALAHYEIARLDPSYRPVASAAMAEDLEPLRARAIADPFHAAPEAFTWGSVERLTGSALEALWYEDLTADRSYRDMAQQQRDWAAQHIKLSGPDAYADFQTPRAVFHDDVNDFVTNEPTINTNALGLAMTSWFVPSDPA